MSYVARLVKGSHVLNLDGSGPYALGLDFVPPFAQTITQIASGTSANRYGRAEVVGRTAAPQRWSFSVRVIGSSAGEVKAATDNLAAFLDMAGDEDEPLYFEWRPANPDVPEPIFGQFGVSRRVKILAADEKSLWDIYPVAGTRERVVFLLIGVIHEPYAYGRPQRVASAKGCIIEDTLGTTDGASRGTIVAPSITNKITNPVFGHATWNNDWGVGADLVAQKNTDPRFILWGSASARVTRIGTRSNYKLTQAINVGNTNTHQLMAYVKKLDGTAVTAADARLYYNDHLTTTYTPCGGGWYRLTASFTGINSSVSCGVAIWAFNTPMFVAGVQLAESSTVVPFVFGDMLGCAWTGTPHASASTSTAGSVRIPTAGILSAGGGTIRMAVRHLSAYDRATNGYLFSDGTFWAAYAQSAYKWRFFDGTDVVGNAGAAQSFASGDIQILHFVWGPAGKQIYLNGELYDTSATLAAWNVGDYLYLGSPNAPSQHFNGTFLGFAVFDRPLTPEQVAADYEQANDWARGGDGFGRRLDSIPWFWTKDGDDVLDNADQGSAQNWGVLAGVPGDVPAQTRIQMTVSGHAVAPETNPDVSVYLSNLNVPQKDWIDPAFLSKTYSTPSTWNITTANHVETITFGSASEYAVIAGRTFSGFVQAADAGSDPLLSITRVTVASISQDSDAVPIIFDSNRSLDSSPAAPVPDVRHLQKDYIISGSLAVALRRTTGSGNVTYYALQFLPHPIVRIEHKANPVSASSFGLVYDDGDTYEHYSTANTIWMAQKTGARLDFWPHQFNTLFVLAGKEDKATGATAVTTTLNSIYVIPRWISP